ncbi:hypothetical protein [Streptomyces mirabilis]|uniref:hypothetical protein n=1 Tax=Streptomyces mirabilis TaxID=68239 RepID=UPI0033B58E8E
MAEPLPLNAAATLNALLTGSGQVSSALRAQLPYARAVGRYGCGCATVDVAVDHTARSHRLPLTAIRPRTPGTPNRRMPE